MQLEVIKLSTSIQKDRFFISINGGISVYPITFESEDDAKAFVGWLKYLQLSDEQIEEHLTQLKYFLNIGNIKAAQDGMKSLLFKGPLTIERSNDNPIRAIEKELEKSCDTDVEDDSGASPPPKPKLKP